MTSLKEEEPFAFVVNKPKVSHTCSFCFALDERKTVSKCRGCRVLSYCSSDCQKSDWVNHKKECGLLKAAKEAADDQSHWGEHQFVPEDMVRLVARILLKSGKALTKKAFNDRTWEDFNDDLPSLTDETAPIFEATINDIMEFLKPLKIVSREEVKSALCKAINHHFDIFEVDIEGKMHKEYIIGVGIYLGFSVHKHNCIPNSQLLFNGTKALLRPFDQEAAYSTDLTISYSPYSPSFFYKEKVYPSFYVAYVNRVWRKKFFRCTCPICVDENHIVNRMGSSCRVNCCEDAAGILEEDPMPSYVCNKCGTPSKITVEQVKSAEDKIHDFVTPKGHFLQDVRIDYKDLRRIIHESEQVLSLYNFRYLDLCNEIANGWMAGGPFFEKEDVQKMCQHHSVQMLKAYRYYLPDTHLLLTRTLMNRAGLKIFLDYLDYFDVDKAIEAAERTYGEHHQITVGFKKAFEEVKRENAKKRDELFRAAGQFKW